jgi:low temperature requirement protein LtrA
MTFMEADGVRTRLFTLLQMLAVAAVAITINDAYAGYHRSFAVAFAVIEAIINYLWWSAGIWDKSHRRFSIYYTINCTALHFVYLLFQRLFDYKHSNHIMVDRFVVQFNTWTYRARAIVKGLKQRGEVFSASAALVERFGLFAIIVLCRKYTCYCKRCCRGEGQGTRIVAGFYTWHCNNFSFMEPLF